MATREFVGLVVSIWLSDDDVLTYALADARTPCSGQVSLVLCGETHCVGAGTHGFAKFDIQPRLLR